MLNSVSEGRPSFWMRIRLLRSDNVAKSASFAGFKFQDAYKKEELKRNYKEERFNHVVGIF